MWHDTRLTKKKSAKFLYKNDKCVDKKIGETLPSTIAKNTIKSLLVTLTKQGKDLTDMNFKCLKKKLKMISQNRKKSHALR